MVLGRISVLDIFCEVVQGRRELSGLGSVIWTWMVILGVEADVQVVNGDDRCPWDFTGCEPITASTSNVRRSLSVFCRKTQRAPVKIRET